MCYTLYVISACLARLSSLWLLSLVIFTSQASLYTSHLCCVWILSCIWSTYNWRAQFAQFIVFENWCTGLSQVFSAFGTVQKIAIFEKSAGFQALVQYPGMCHHCSFFVLHLCLCDVLVVTFDNQFLCHIILEGYLCSWGFGV